MSKEGIAQLILEAAGQKPADSNSFTPDNRIYGNASLPTSQAVDSLVAKEKQRGFDQGYQEGVARAQAEWQPKLAYLNELLSALESPLKEFDQEAQQKSVEICIAVAKQIIRRELSIDSGQIVAAIKQAIELIPKDGQQVNIFINPNDATHVENLFSQNGDVNKFNIVQDPTITAGGCRASTDYSLVDLSIEKQVAMIAAQIFGDQRKPAD